jgi:hypothetical protein
MELVLRDTLNQLASLPEYRGKVLEARAIFVFLGCYFDA